MNCDKSHETVGDAMVTGLIKAPRVSFASRAQLKTRGYSEISSAHEKKTIYRYRLFYNYLNYQSCICYSQNVYSVITCNN